MQSDLEKLLERLGARLRAADSTLKRALILVDYERWTEVGTEISKARAEISRAETLRLSVVISLIADQGQGGQQR